MNLEYLEIMNIEKGFKTTIPQKLKALEDEDKFRIGDNEEYFVEVVSKDMSLRNYGKQFLIKKNIVKKNIESMIRDNCMEIHSPISHGKVLGEGFFGHVVESTADITNNTITYDSYGSSKIIVKIMKNKKSSGNDAEDLYKYLSDIAKEVRAGQCLYNIFNYDFDTDRFNSIKYRMEDRDMNISSVVNGNEQSFSSIDAVGVMDCKFYTPSNEKTSNRLGSVNINDKTKFYLGMPAMDGNLEEFFFGEETYEDKKLKKHEVWVDNVALRVKITFQMVEAVKNIHDLGFINKDIKPENFLYLEHETYGEDPNLIFSLADFGLSGIDDFNTFQYSDMMYRPMDEHLEMTKKLDMYQVGISLFQVLFNIPKAETKGNLSLKLISQLVSANGMSALLNSYKKNDWSVIRSLNLMSGKEECIKRIVKNLYDELCDYSFPNNSSDYHFDNFILEIKNVRSSMQNHDYLKITSQMEFQLGIRSFFISNFVSDEECSDYSKMDFRMIRNITRTIHADPTMRLSAVNLLKNYNRVRYNTGSMKGADLRYFKVIPYDRRVIL